MALRYRTCTTALSHLLLGGGMRSAYIGEAISTASHMLQAAEAARRERHDEEVVLACLLHDVGHLIAPDDTGGFGVSDHARVGACLLRGLGVPERTCRAVELHVDAKRYLVGADPGYVLSPASARTLAFQGGPMTDAAERAAFEADPSHADAMAVRTLDDGGKVRDLDHASAYDSWASFFPLFRRHVA